MRKSREIQIGNIFMGGDNPVVIQSMTNTFTKDAEATIKGKFNGKQRGVSL